MKKEFTFSYRHLKSIDELTDDQKKVFAAAEKACKKAYAPYSKFKVGAALLLNDDTLVLRSEEHTSELQSRPHLVCRLLLEKKKKNITKQSLPNKTNTKTTTILH